MDKKERLERCKSLINKGVKSKNIATILGVSESTIKRDIRSLKTNFLTKVKRIKFDDYSKNIIAGYYDKEELAERLKISKKTLLEYEKDGALKIMAKYFFFYGYPQIIIKQRLHTKNDITKYFIQAPNLDNIIKELNYTIEFLALLSNINMQITTDVGVLKKVYNKLNQIHFFDKQHFYTTETLKEVKYIFNRGVLRNRTKIDIKDYLEVVLNAGIQHKEKLAQKLNVPKRTLIYYEQNGLHLVVSKYLYLYGYSEKEICKILIARTQKVKSYLMDTFSINETINKLNNSIELLSLFSNVDNYITTDITILQSAKNKLSNVKTKRNKNVNFC